jgi:methyltransferase (TIGR00027 family)
LSVWIVSLLTALILAIPEGAFAVRPGEVSLTAEINAAQRAVAAMHPDKKIRNPDYLAEKFVSDDFWYYYHYSRDFDRSMEFVKTFRVGGYYYANARTKHIDKLFRHASNNGLEQVVLLGAGFDSRAYRLGKKIPGVRFFELDHPPTSARKQEKLREIFSRPPANVHFVPIDFKSWNVEESLEKAGYDSKKTSCFILEGVSMFLPKEAVDRTLRFIATQSAAGSTVIFDYIPEVALAGDAKQYPGFRRIAFRMALAGEPLLSGLPEKTEALTSYMQDSGLELLSNVGHEELTRMYLIGSDGQPDGNPSTYYKIAHARVPAP